MQPLSETSIRRIRSALLHNFDTAARDLPWRTTKDPYAVWVSEVMLQQTRAETIGPYYGRWLDRYPDVHALADAHIDDVLKLWEGLGYYSRARNLHSAARIIRERYNGELPDTYADLRALPGIGDYTAGAVASIAFERREPAVDGNVRRVIARLLDLPDPDAATLRSVATSLVPHDRPGDFNQALMEFGATICTPRAPRCDRCPLTSLCAARANDTQLMRPAPKQRAAPPLAIVATAVIRRVDGRFFIVRRPDTGLLAGMWNFPGIEVQDSRDVASAALSVAASFDFEPLDATELCSITHVFSHRRERYDCFLLHVEDRGHRGRNVAWIADTTRRALPRAQQRILAHALAAPTAQRCDNGR